MILSFPNTGHEFLVLIVPVLTFLLGICFLVVPGRLFKFMGLEAQPSSPEAMGEGRSSFAGPLIAVPLGCLLLQQPSLFFMLATGWTIAAFGRILQMVLDKGLRKRVQVRFILAAGMALAAWSVVEIPGFNCADPFGPYCSLPADPRGWLLFAIAGLTLLLGLIAMFAPGVALSIMKLQTHIKTPFARGETRGTLGGFYAAIGATYLLLPQPVDFVALVMGAAWVFTGIGRLLSVFVDRGWTYYNGLAVIFELGTGLVAIGLILGII